MVCPTKDQILLANFKLVLTHSLSYETCGPLILSPRSSKLAEGICNDVYSDSIAQRDSSVVSAPSGHSSHFIHGALRRWYAASEKWRRYLKRPHLIFQLSGKTSIDLTRPSPMTWKSERIPSTLGTTVVRMLGDAVFGVAATMLLTCFKETKEDD